MFTNVSCLFGYRRYGFNCSSGYDQYGWFERGNTGYRAAAALGQVGRAFTAFGMLLSVSAENEKAGKQEVENNFNPEGRLPDEDIALQKAE